MRRVATSLPSHHLDVDRSPPLVHGGGFEPEEAEEFERAQYSLDALLLGRLDDFTHDAGRTVPPLTSWLACIESITARVHRERSRCRLERLPALG